LINVCLGTAWHVRGAANVLDRVKIELGIDVGGMTEDKLFSLETVNCLGACALGPVVVIGDEYHGQMNPAKVKPTIRKFKKAKGKK
ncbi:MAG: NAD(P)H-dependent oxidoreductase subunit E, partial [Desulfobacteraceae bacterium]|nr:NAD(P)H-dependent oxidoreductase subunit E [Desulfobacteraceae bacterium]